MSNIPPPVESAFGELKSRDSIIRPIQLIGRIVILGSSPSSDVSLNLPGISARQCRFSKSGRSVMLEELSNDKTLLNGQYVVARTEIRTGDILTFGTLEFEFANLIPSAASAAPQLDIDTAIDDIAAVTFDSFEVKANADAGANTDVGAEVWYAEALGRTLGPLSEDELTLLVRSGGLTPLDLVHNGDTNKAKPCGSLSFLAEYFASQTNQKSKTELPESPTSVEQLKVRRRKRKRKSKSAGKSDDSTTRIKSAAGQTDDEQVIDDIMNDVLLGDEPATPPTSPVAPAKFVPTPPSPSELAVEPKRPESSAIQAAIDQAAPAEKSVKKKRKSSGSSFNIKPGLLVKPAMILGGLTSLYFIYPLLTFSFSAPIDRSAAIEQISNYSQEIKSARASKDKSQLEALGQRIKTETAEMVTILERETDRGASFHMADRTILSVLRDALPEAIAAPMDDKIFIGVVESRIAEATWHAAR